MKRVAIILIVLLSQTFEQCSKNRRGRSEDGIFSSRGSKSSGDPNDESEEIEGYVTESCIYDPANSCIVKGPKFKVEVSPGQHDASGIKITIKSFDYKTEDTIILGEKDTDLGEIKVAVELGAPKVPDIEARVSFKIPKGGDLSYLVLFYNSDGKQVITKRHFETGMTLQGEGVISVLTRGEIPFRIFLLQFNAKEYNRILEWLLANGYFLYGIKLEDLSSSHLSTASLRSGRIVQWVGQPGVFGSGPMNEPFVKNITPFAFKDQRFVVAASIGVKHSCLILNDGSLYCYGNNQQGQLGYPQVEVSASLQEIQGFDPIDLGVDRLVAEVTVGNEHTCARFLFKDDVKCWGGNANDTQLPNYASNEGALGLGDTISRGKNQMEMGDQLPVVNIGGRARNIAAGAGDTCAVLTNGDLKCWGCNFKGELGLGDKSSRLLPSSVNLGTEGFSLTGEAVKPNKAISVFLSHSESDPNMCVILSNGQAKCFGGHIGYPLKNDIDKNGDYYFGDSPERVGDAVPNLYLGGSEARVRKLAIIGSPGICALLWDGRVKCFGTDKSGSLGLGLMYNWSDYATTKIYTKENLPFVKTGSPEVVNIAAGNQHVCIRYLDGNTTCWGHYVSIGYGNGAGKSIGDDPDEMPPPVHEYRN